MLQKSESNPENSMGKYPNRLKKRIEILLKIRSLTLQKGENMDLKT
jgi:hypothetical protein